MVVFLTAFVYSFGATSDPKGDANESDDDVPITADKWTKKAVRDAIEFNLRTGEQLKKVADYSSAARCLRQTARFQLIISERSAAITNLKRALDLNGSIPPFDVVKNLTLYSKVLIEGGKASEAETYIKQAQQIVSRLDVPGAKAYVLRGDGELKEDRGDYAEAETDLLSAVEIFRGVRDKLQLARTLVTLSGVRISLGKAINGLADAKEAKLLFLDVGDERGAIFSQLLVGHHLSSLGKKQEALDEYLDAEKRFPEDVDRIEKARLANGIGFVYQGLGDLNHALEKRKEAFLLFELEQYWYAAAVTLAPLIDLSFRMGDDTAAFEYLKRSEDLEFRTKNRLILSISFLHVGDHYFSIKEDKLAAYYYRRSLPVFEQTNLLVVTAGIYDKLGSIFARKGRFKQARDYFDRSLTVSRQIRDKLGEANTLFNLANLEAEEGKTLEALKLAEASIDSAETLSASVRNSRLRSSHFATICDRYDLYIRLLMRAAKETSDLAYVKRALQSAERARARRMVKNLEVSGTNIPAGASADLVAKEREMLESFRIAADDLTNSLAGNADPADIEKLEADVDRLQHELEDVRAEIMRQSPAYSAIKDPEPFDLADFQQNVLDDRSVLLEFWLGEKESYLWVVDNTEVRAHVLPGRAEVNTRVASLISLLQSGEPREGEPIEEYQRRVALSEEQYWQQARELSNQLLGDAAQMIAGKRLIIVADGGLHSLPFAALPLPRSDNNEPILATNEVVFEPSAQTLSLLTRMPSRPDSAQRRDIAVFSDPVFSPNDERLTRKNPEHLIGAPTIAASFRFVDTLDSLNRLQGSRRETDAILKVAPTKSADKFEGFSATREKFLNANLGNYKVLHLATHAVADGERPDLSGVVFSRYGRDGSRLDELVRLQDIYALNLNADLVVLSACSTATGKLVRGEGVASLNNAFLQAGSRSVLSTLWKIDDEAARILMTSFYEGIARERLTPTESLRKARIVLRNDPRFRSPFYWGAFTLHGDPNVKPEISSPRRPWAFAIIGLSILLPGLLFLYRRRRRRMNSRPQLTE